MISVFSRARLGLHLLPEVAEGVFLEPGYDRRSRRSGSRRRCVGIGEDMGRGPLSLSWTWPYPSPPHRFPLLSFPLTHWLQINPLRHQNKGPSMWKWLSKYKFVKNYNSISHSYKIPGFNIRVLFYFVTAPSLWIKYGNLVSDSFAIFVTLVNYMK